VNVDDQPGGVKETWRYRPVGSSRNGLRRVLGRPPFARIGAGARLVRREAGTR